jgi:hypothetical protein
MSAISRPPWLRLGCAALLMTALSVAFELYSSGGISTVDEIPSVVIGSALYAVVYFVCAPMLWGVSFAAARVGIPGWLTFPVLFTLAAAALSYKAMSMYEYNEHAGVPLVSDHHLTVAGWKDFRMRMTQDLVISSLAGLILFWNQRKSPQISN